MESFPIQMIGQIGYYIGGRNNQEHKIKKKKIIKFNQSER